MDPDSSVDSLVDFVRSRFFGKYRGTITNDLDPTSRGRVQVIVPAVLGDLVLWAMPCVPYAGPGVGFYTIPPIGAGVWVEFEGGDASYPIWVGCFWGDGELPDASDPAVKILKTTGLSLRLDDNALEAKLESLAGGTVTVTSDIELNTALASQTVGASGVVSEAGTAKCEVGMASFKVNDGALEVL